MGDVVALLAAGGLLMVYAIAAPNLIEAIPSPGANKPFPQRLSQAAAAAPVSAVSGVAVAAWR